MNSDRTQFCGTKRRDNNALQKRWLSVSQPLKQRFFDALPRSVADVIHHGFVTATSTEITMIARHTGMIEDIEKLRQERLRTP
jgi:hypothetical protein